MLAFAPHLGVHVLSDEEVVLLSERDRFALSGRVYVALAPLLNGTRSPDGIVDELADEHPAALIHFALMRLQRQGSVVESALLHTAHPAAAKTASSLPELGRAATSGIAHTLDQTISIGVPASWAHRLEDAVGPTRPVEQPDTDHSSAARLTVCLVDDYLRPELAKTAAACLGRGEAVLVVRPVGRWLWFGPLLEGPGSQPGWQLFHERMRMNRFADVTALERGASFPLFPDDRSPATVELALSMAGVLVSRVLDGTVPPELIDGMLTYDTVEGITARHVVAGSTMRRDGRAPAFGQAVPPMEPHGGGRGSGGGGRACPPGASLARLEPFVSPITGIVSAVETVPGAGNMHVFTAVHSQAPVATRPRGRTLGRKGGASGKGFDEVQARVSCIGEAVERYSGGFFGDEPRRSARFAEIAEIALHPEDLLLFSEAQYASRRSPANDQSADAVPARFDASQAIEWVPFSSVVNGETRWLPAAYCYYGYAASGAGGYRGDPYCVADSNGCASGNTLEEAALHGLLELIERDACGLAWYNRARRPEIDLDSFEGRPFAPVRESMARRDRELRVLDLRTDTHVPVALAVAWNRADGLATRFALGCHLNPRLAVSKALAELAQLEAEAEAPGAEPGDAMFASDSIHDQPYLTPSDRTPVSAGNLPDLTGDSIADELRWCCRMLAPLGHDVLVLDQTRPEVGFPTVRVVVPGLRHFWRRLAPGRLYDVPVKIGWIDVARTEDEMNPLSVLI